MLPIPVDSYIPRAFKRDSRVAALSAKIQAHLEEWKADVLNFDSLIDPVRIKASLLDEMGYLLNAGIFVYDTNAQKVLKIHNAIAGHKKRGSWVYDAKPKIDAICGGDAKLVTAIGLDDWILVDDGVSFPSAYYYAALGCDGIDDDLGISLIGSGYEIEVAGNVYIDVDNPVLTATQIQQVVNALASDIAPGYYYVHIGYISVGAYVEYAVIG